MCGIVGKIWLDPERPGDREGVARMAATLIHRGPDDEGFHVAGPAALGFRRLSIIDVAGGNQPILNEDGRLAIVFNGEIYNYRDLRRELETRGHRFKTRGDAETIVHLYEEAGPACVERLRGMFALAIWDARERTLFLAVDRPGKKPLYWTRAPDALLFASEMKALLVDPAVERRLDPAALSSYLTYQYVPAPETIFQGIHKLAPATRMLFKLRDGAVDPPRAERYWSLRYQPKSSATAEEAEAESIERLDEAVRDRLESEVPLGVLLSGGVDSSAVVAMARRHISGPLRTFSIGFREASHNELPHARAVAERYATEHEEFIVEPRAAEAIERIVWHFDEPFADASALPTFHLCEMTRRRVTVALAGDGGDESFVGYERYRGLPKLRRFERIPRAVRAGLIRPMARLAGRVANGSAFFEKLSLANEISLSDFERRYLAYLTVFHEGMKARLLPGGAMTPDALEWSIRAMRESDAVEPFDRMMACDVATYLPGDLLVKVDRMSMANSLEVRSPFLDDRLMEFAARLPAEIKAPGGELKGLLKRALEPHLPREVLHRPKQGFGVPLDRWFREDLNDMLRDALLGDRARARGLFAMDYVARLIDDHSTGRFRHSHRLWALLVFELWARAHLDRTPSAESPSVEEIAHRTTPSP